MYVSPETLQLIFELGIEPEKMVRLFKALERDALSVTALAHSSGINEERERLRNASTYAERKRAKDRERQAAIREAARLHRESPAIRPAIHGDPQATACDTVATAGEQTLPLPPSPQTPQPPTPTRVRDISTRMREAFDRWWADYPRKVGKEDAWRKYQIAARKIGDDFEPALSGGLERAKAAWTDAQFIPHPATWLHQGRWEDEPTVINLAPRQAHAQRPDAKRQLREANLDRALAGAEAAARARAERG